MKIMLVEDNEAIIMGLEYLLSQEGYQVVTGILRRPALFWRRRSVYLFCWILDFLTGTDLSCAGK